MLSLRYLLPVAIAAWTICIDQISAEVDMLTITEGVELFAKLVSNRAIAGDDNALNKKEWEKLQSKIKGFAGDDGVFNGDEGRKAWKALGLDAPSAAINDDDLNDFFNILMAKFEEIAFADKNKDKSIGIDEFRTLVALYGLYNVADELSGDNDNKLGEQEWKVAQNIFKDLRVEDTKRLEETHFPHVPDAYTPVKQMLSDTTVDNELVLKKAVTAFSKPYPRHEVNFNEFLAMTTA